MKKYALILICFLLSALLFCSCGQTSNPTPSGTSAPDNSSTVNGSDSGNIGDTPEFETDENGYVKDDIPELDYGNQDFTVIGWTEGYLDFDGTQESEDTIGQATYTRNTAVADRLNINLIFDTSIKGDNANRTEYIATVETNLKAGQPYDLIACYSMNAANFAVDGYLSNLESYPMLELDKPYWSSNIQQACRLNNQIYFASGPISSKNTLETMILILNLEKMNDVGLSDPRYLVQDMEWTMEEFYAMCASDVSVDNNQDGKDPSDSFGLVMEYNVYGDMFLIGNGLHYLETDENGLLQLAEDFQSERTFNLVQTLCAKFASSDFYYVLDGWHSNIFYEDRALFMGANFGVLRSIREQIGFSYAYLPSPMADTAQGEYYSVCGFPFTMYCIPANVQDGECSAYVMECLASESYRTIQPVIFDSIKYQYSDDPLNAEMFDTIIGSVTYDFGRLFHNSFAWPDSPVAIFRESLYNNNPEFYSTLDAHIDAIQKALGEINRKFYEGKS